MLRLTNSTDDFVTFSDNGGVSDTSDEFHEPSLCSKDTGMLARFGNDGSVRSDTGFGTSAEARDMPRRASWGKIIMPPYDESWTVNDDLFEKPVFLNK